MEQEYITILAIGFIAGLLDYSFAVGFGLIASLALAGIMGLDPLNATGAIAFAQIVTAVPAIIAHNKAGNIKMHPTTRRHLLSFSLSSFTTAGILALGLAHISHTVTTTVYILLLALIPVFTITAHSKTHIGEDASKTQFKSILYGALAGAYKAIVGGGYTLIIVAAQSRLGINIKTAIATSPLLKLLPFTTIAIIYYVTGKTDTAIAATLTLGSLFSTIPSSLILKQVDREDKSKKMYMVIMVFSFFVVIYKLYLLFQ